MDKRKNNNIDAVEILSGDIEVRNGMEVHCIGLENIPVTNAELDVLETYASDLIRILVAEARARDKPFDVVIVHSQSRFARNTLDLLHYTKKLEKTEVQLVSIAQDIGSSDQADVLRTILGAMDEYQSKETSNHVSRSMCENARQGFWNGAHPPFGYRTDVAEKRGKKDKKKLEINPVEAEIMRRIFKLYIHGEGDKGPMGMKAIANLLNTEGIPTHKDSKFLVQYIHKILNNEAYV